MILMIDNYDSFTYNLVRYFEELGQKVLVKRNDAISLQEIEMLNPEHIVISPGPSTPYESGVSLNVINLFAGKIPILGVCLGHQCIAQVYGATIKRARVPMHGKQSQICHQGTGLFKDLQNFLSVTRYHSLIVDPKTLSQCISVTAETKEGEIMAIAHKTLPLVGVQFHPEAVLTEGGHRLLSNFIEGDYR